MKFAAIWPESELNILHIFSNLVFIPFLGPRQALFLNPSCRCENWSYREVVYLAQGPGLLE